MEDTMSRKGERERHSLVPDGLQSNALLSMGKPEEMKCICCIYSWRGERERGGKQREGGEGGGEIGRTREVLVFFLDRT